MNSLRIVHIILVQGLGGVDNVSVECIDDRLATSRQFQRIRDLEIIADCSVISLYQWPSLLHVGEEYQE